MIPAIVMQTLDNNFTSANTGGPLAILGSPNIDYDIKAVSGKPAILNLFMIYDLFLKVELEDTK